MRHAHDDDGEFRVGNRINHPISAHTQPISVAISRKLRAIAAARIIGERSDPGDQAATVFLLADGFDFSPG